MLKTPYSCLVRTPEQLQNALHRLAPLSGKFLYEIHTEAMIELIEKRQRFMKNGKKIEYLVSPQGKPMHVMLASRALLSRIERIAAQDGIKKSRFFYTAISDYVKNHVKYVEEAV